MAKIPATDNTVEAIQEAEEPNEESKNEQQESGTTHQVIEDDDTVKTLWGGEEMEPPLAPDTKRSTSGVKGSSRKHSLRSVHLSQRSQQPSSCQSLLNPKVLQQPPSIDPGVKGSVAWLSQRTGKEMKCKSNQTSSVWERKPLAEILLTSSKTPQGSEGTEKDKIDAMEAITPVQGTETKPDATKGSVHSVQLLEVAEGQGGNPSPVKQESEHGQQPEELSQVQPPNKAMMEGDIKLISKKTGKELKCSLNQTSLLWEKKPLAEILHPPSPKTQSPEKVNVAPEVAEIKQETVQEDSPSTPQLEEQESQHGSQQLEESKHDDGQEAPEEAPEAPEEAPEAAPEAQEEAPEAPEEAPEAAPEAAPEEAPEVAPEAAPEEAPEAQEEAPEAAPEAASEEAPES
uniref:Uncharacterized protein n=1 Tax=Sphaerodactylus townsendi TaxID=933632 RepID=A0ACB8G5K5_9SAUR